MVYFSMSPFFVHLVGYLLAFSDVLLCGVICGYFVVNIL